MVHPESSEFRGLTLVLRTLVWSWSASLLLVIIFIYIARLAVLRALGDTDRILPLVTVLLLDHGDWALQSTAGIVLGGAIWATCCGARRPRLLCMYYITLGCISCIVVAWSFLGLWPVAFLSLRD